MGKKTNKFLAASVITSVAVTAISPVGVSANSFKDVSFSYEEAVSFLENKGIKGFSATEFGIHKEIKRVDAAVMLVAVLGIDPSKAPDSGFTDVPERAKAEVNLLKHLGITSGKTATTFDSNSPITRGELAIWIQTAFELKGTDKVDFSDVGSRYISAVSALVENKITQGISLTQYGTTQKAKRGDFAKFLLKAHANTDDKDLVTINNTGEVTQDLNLNPSGSKNIIYGPESGQLIVNGNVTIAGDANKQISLRNIVIKGKLVVNTPNASVVIEKSTKVEGITSIENVASHTFTNKGVLGKVELLDVDGTRFINDPTAEIETLNVNTSGDVVLGGSIPTVIIDQASKVQLADSTTVNQLTVNGSVTLELADSSTVNNVEAAAPLVLDGEGKVQSITGSEASKVSGNNESITVAVENGKPPVQIPASGSGAGVGSNPGTGSNSGDESNSFIPGGSSENSPAPDNGNENGSDEETEFTFLAIQEKLKVLEDRVGISEGTSILNNADAVRDAVDYFYDIKSVVNEFSYGLGDNDYRVVELLNRLSAAKVVIDVAREVYGVEDYVIDRYVYSADQAIMYLETLVKRPDEMVNQEGIFYVLSIHDNVTASLEGLIEKVGKDAPVVKEFLNRQSKAKAEIDKAIKGLGLTVTEDNNFEERIVISQVSDLNKLELTFSTISDASTNLTFNNATLENEKAEFISVNKEDSATVGYKLNPEVTDNKLKVVFTEPKLVVSGDSIKIGLSINGNERVFLVTYNQSGEEKEVWDIKETDIE